MQETSSDNKKARIMLSNQFEASMDFVMPNHIESNFEQSTLSEMYYHWQFGNWAEVLKIVINGITDRVILCKLELLVGSAHFQLGNIVEAKKHFERSENLGCDTELIQKIMLSGSYTTLGVMSDLANLHEHALDNIQKSLNLVGIKDTDKIISKTRINNSKIILLDKQNYVSNINYSDVVTSGPLNQKLLDFKSLNKEFFDRICSSVFSDDESSIQVINKLLSETACEITQSNQIIDFTFDKIEINSTSYYITHVVGDYIPEKIKKSKNFYEINFLEFVRKFYSKDEYIIDIGANIGNHSMYFASKMGAKVLSFEPQPHNVICLESNIHLNNLEHLVLVHRFGLGSFNGTVDIKMHRDMNFGTFSAKSDINSSNSDSSFFTIEVKKLDDAIDENLKISMIKIDVEGMEYDVLLGATDLIKIHRPLITTECLDVAEYLKIERLLAYYNYVPIDVLNADPSFIFMCLDNEWHKTVYFNLLRDKNLAKLDWFTSATALVEQQSYKINDSSSDYLTLSDDSYLINIDIIDSTQLSINCKTQFIGIDEKIKNKALLTINFIDAANQEIDMKKDGLPFSEVTNSYYRYLPNTYQVFEEIVKLNVPLAAKKLKLGFKGFYLKSPEQVLIGNDILITIYK